MLVHTAIEIRFSVVAFKPPLDLLGFQSQNLLLSDCRELYKSKTGTLDVNEELELVTLDLCGLVRRLQSSLPTDGADLPNHLPGIDPNEQIPLKAICCKATAVATELLSRLEHLKVEGSEKRKWKSLGQAVRSAWSNNQVKELNERLSTLRKAIETQVLFSMRDSLDAQSVCAAARFEKLDQQTQQIITSLVASSERQSQDVVIALSQLVSRLEEICQVEHQRTRELIFQSWGPQDPSTTVEDITVGIEMLDVSQSKESKLRASVQTRILKSLYFPTMTNRYESVLEPYSETFEWAFGDSTTEQRPWSNLARWMRKDNGVYWINGKAGSGKSTLMKHICEDPRTRQYLERWAQKEQPHTAPLCLATFFFWNSGSSWQKSQVGMLRTLLFQVLNQKPDLIPLILSTRWARTYSGELTGKPDLSSTSWSFRECVAAFKALLQQKIVPLKMCLLIDGLDECEGDHDDLVELCMSMTNLESQNIKICLSSRPWVIFEDGFHACPTLRLQDLTYGNIKHYVSDKFHCNPAFKILMAREPTLAPALIEEVVQSAHGVFLWVRLVVKSLLDGIRNRDAMPDLLRRLRQLPRDLEPLYQHLLGLVEPIYTEWASTAFEIVRVACDREFIPFGQKIGGEGVQSLTLLAFHLAIKGDIKITNVDNLTHSSLSMGCQDTAVHLNARCCGLLEVLSVSQVRYGTVGIPEQQQLVQFFHRTVREFLEKRENWSRIQRGTKTTECGLYLALLRSHALLLRMQLPLRREGILKDLNDTAYSTFVYAYHVDLYADTQHTRQAQRDTLEYVGKIANGKLLFWPDEVATRILNKRCAWEDILSEVFNLEQAAAGANTDIQVSLLRIVKVLLRAGADPRKGVICQNIGKVSIQELLTKHLMPRFPQEADELLIEVKRKLNIKNLIGSSLTEEREEDPRGAKRQCVSILEIIN